MAEREITTVFKADISNFSASTQQLNRYMAQVNAEFKNSTASMTRWNDNSEGLRAKLTQLNGVLDAESRKLKMLEDSYNELTDEQKKNTKQGQDLARAINEQSAKVKETKKNIDYYADSLKELEDAGVETRQELDNINKELEEQKQAAKDLGSGILKGAAVGIAGIGAACVGAMAGLSNIVEETKELRTQLGMLETAFTEAGHSVETSEKTYNELFSVLGDADQATEASLHLAEFAKNEKELEELTNSLTGAYARFGKSLPVENIAEGVNTTLTLNQANAGMVDAIEFAGGSVEEFNAKLQSLDSEEEKRAFILQTLNESYGEAGETYKEVNKEVIAANDAQNKYNQAMADIGEKAQPAITSFKTAMVGVLQTILEKFDEVDLEGLIGKIGTAITNLVDTVLPPLMSALTWVLDNANWLVPVLGTLIGLVAGITAGIKIYNGVVKVAKAVQQAWNLVMKANPIGLVITAIGLLVTAFVTLWNKCEGFRNFWKGLWDGIKSVATGAVNGIIAIFEKALNGIISFINGITQGLSKVWTWTGLPSIPKIPKVSIPRLAEGGIVDNATLAVVGEAGKEVVMPLENNTEWIDKLAEKLNAQVSKQPTQSTVVNVNNHFEKMETTRFALHKANLETRRILREV